MTEKTFLKITPLAIEAEDLSFPDALQLIASALLHLMNGALNFALPDEREGLRGDVYDAVNEAMGSILEKFSPEAREFTAADIDAELIKENDAIYAALDTLRSTNPRLYKKRKKITEAQLSEARARLIQSANRSKKVIDINAGR